MKLRLLLSFLSLFLLQATSACSTKTTLSPQKNIPYETHAVKKLPPLVQAKAKEMKQQKISNDDTSPGSTLFYTNHTNYVLITSGWKPTGGYTIRINRVSPGSNGVTIYASDIPPAKDAMVEQVISAPLIAISIPDEVKNIKVIWE